MKLLALLAALAALLLPALPASASSSADDPPSAADVAAARTAVAGSRDTVGKFFATKGQRGVAPAKVNAQVDGPTVTVNDLNPDFVSGRSDQIARFAFLATQATAPDGQKASIWTTRTPSGGWAVSNIASGDDEQRFGAQAGTVFREPQLNAWYAVRDGQVVALNQEATSSIGAAPVPVAAYRSLVQQRYGSKLPGSSYARDGYAGGYPLPSPPPPANPLPWIVAAATLAAAAITIRLLRRPDRAS